MTPGPVVPGRPARRCSEGRVRDPRRQPDERARIVGSLVPRAGGRGNPEDSGAGRAVLDGAVAAQPHVAAVLAALLAIALVVVGWFGLRAILDGWSAATTARETATLVRFGVVAGDFVHALQAERGLSVGFVASEGERFGNDLRDQREAVDAAGRALSIHLEEHGAELPAQARRTVGADALAPGELDPLRERVTALRASSDEIVDAYAGVIAELLDGLEHSLAEVSDEALLREVMAYAALMRAKEAAGLTRAGLNDVFAVDELPRGRHHTIGGLVGEQDAYLERFRAHAAGEVVAFYEDRAESEEFAQVEEVQRTALSQAGERGLGVAPEWWFEASSARIDGLREVGQAHAEFVLGEAERVEDGAVRGLLVDAGVSGLALVLLAVLVVDRHRAGVRLSRLALDDPLTGLANRRGLLQRLGQALRRVRARGGRVGVLFVDLDRFKLINDGWGHQAGDELLVAVARRLEQACPRAVVVARLGGDEFVVVFEGLPEAEEAAVRRGLALAEGVKEAVDGPYELSGGEVLVAASVGVTASGIASQPGELLREADAAMLRAKHGSPSGVAAFDDRLRRHSSERLELTAALHRAVAEGELEVYYQPEVDLRTGALFAYEALLRWQRPGHGTVSPARFLPVAEEAGLMPQLGAWVLDRACADATGVLRDERGEPAPVAVNLSPSELERPELVDTVRAALRRHGLPPQRLFVEITESAMVDEPEQALRTLTALRQLGVRIAVDDFGTGYSALTHLVRYPVDVVKIDRVFVAPLPSSGTHRDIVHAIVDLARSLDLVCVAEGVETEDQAADLRALGCDTGQGFHWGVPKPPGDIARERAQRLRGAGARVSGASSIDEGE